MLKTSLYGALIAVAALTPALADSCDVTAGYVITPLGAAIAAQGNQALKKIQSEARLCLRSQKPAPLDAFVQDVKREVEPTAVVQEL